MAIIGYDKYQFGEKLNEVLSASQPIQSVEHLYGRTTQLDQIEKALFAPGRHIFIFGDRGVGKSSLAATAANQYQSTDSPYIDVGCSPKATMNNIVANIADQAINASRLRRTKISKSIHADFRYLKAALTSETSATNLHEEIVSLADAVGVLKEAAMLHSDQPVVVLDEFDRIADPAERCAFADLVKQLGDKKVPLKIIFTGVANSLDELLGAHESAIRQFEGIELPKLSWEARWDIVLSATNTFGLSIDREIYIRIAAVCDGYPYYAHFITEKMLWRVFEDKDFVTQITWDHYYAGLRDAIESISAQLKRPYQDAVNKRSPDYEEVLWATADSEYLERFMRQMYGSYEHIMRQRRGRTTLTYDKFSARIRKLREPSFGAILTNDTSNSGLYTYREKMLRGFVRMQAEAHGIKLAGEDIDQTVRRTMRVPASVGRGYYASKPPPGIHWDRERVRNDDGEE